MMRPATPLKIYCPYQAKDTSEARNDGGEKGSRPVARQEMDARRKRIAIV